MCLAANPLQSSTSSCCYKILHDYQMLFPQRVFAFSSSPPTPLEIPVLLHTFLLKLLFFVSAPLPWEFSVTLLGVGIDIFWNCTITTYPSEQFQASEMLKLTLTIYFTGKRAQNLGMSFLTFIILYNNLIPISLTVTLEVLQFQVYLDRFCTEYHIHVSLILRQARMR